ncbi:Hypothetical Protein FCC1311_010662 [Hondaea fermentalgiana]|uniref:Uncharacterized protein n=1 Tax=Hondaea fermentalgiana TaxID=2315210 RepID=A0A2R5G4Y2_9STRA|nr:Hypothetical Protein FCC1311_010662 [Hondaea fermentalgiana]|eukprot:GBG24848.1 Hypothetical Protein FCC1311_010662 [Hondaea fermentalgiana]
MRTTPHGADSLWKKLGAWRQIFAKKADKPELKSILKHTSCGPSRSQRGLHAHKKKSLECIEAKHVHFGVCSVISDSGELLGCVEVGTEAPCLSADPVARATLLCFQRPTEDPEKSRESNDVDQQEDDSQLSETSSSAHVSVSATRMASQSAPCAVTNLVSTPPAPVPHSGVMVI